MKPRWHLSKDKIAQLLEMHGLEVRMWDVEDGVFLGAIVDGCKPDWDTIFELGEKNDQTSTENSKGDR